MANDEGTRIGQHPLLVAVAALEAVLVDAVGVPTWALSAAEADEVLVVLSRCRSRLAGLEAGAVVAADRLEIGGPIGATSTGVHWAEATRQTRARATSLVRHATALAGRHAEVGDALVAGRVLPEQAEVICAAVDALPERLGTGVVAAARARLLDLAQVHDATELRRLGKRILEVVAPEVAEEEERRRLEREEAAAEAAATLHISRDGHGKVHGRFTLPEAEADMLLIELDALAAPRHHHATHGTTPPPVDAHGERVPRPRRRGMALCEYIRNRHTGGTPEAGGVAATVTVELDLAQLLGASDAPVSLDTGTRITAGKARLWACGAGIVPVVLGGDSVPLDVGRTRRYFTKHQRLVLARLQGGCTAEGCDWPPGLCHAHHRTPWAHGGTTDLTNGYLLCPRHHARAHDPTYDTTYGHHRVTFHRRT